MSHAPTQTSSHHSISFSLPNGPVTIVFPTPYSDSDSDSDSPTSHTTVINRIPSGSSWGPPLHWHETHTEHFCIRRGFALVTIGHVTRILGPNDGVATIQPFTLHGFCRADTEEARRHWGKTTCPTGVTEDQEWVAEDVEVEEWTDPADGQKEIFFRNGMSFYRDYIQDFIIPAGGAGTSQSFQRRVLNVVKALPTLTAKGLQMMAFQKCHDNYLLMIPVSIGQDGDGKANPLARGVTNAVLGFAALVGWTVGWRYWWEEYTPVRLWGTCERFFGSAGKLKNE